MRAKLLTVASLMLVLSGAAQAQSDGDPLAGERKAATCIGCHGIEGSRNAYPSYRVPKLAGQHAEYMVSALEAYASGRRQHPTMQALASTLSEEDMADIAAYFEAVGEDGE